MFCFHDVSDYDDDVGYDMMMMLMMMMMMMIEQINTWRGGVTNNKNTYLIG